MPNGLTIRDIIEPKNHFSNMSETSQTKTHFYKITNASKLKFNFPDTEIFNHLSLVGDEYYGQSDSPVEAGVVALGNRAICELKPVKDTGESFLEDLLSLKATHPDILLNQREWSIRSVTNEAKPVVRMRTDNGDEAEVTKDFILTGIGRGHVASLISPGGVGKSFLTLQCLFNMAIGKATPFTRKTEKRKVVYISLEDCLLDINNRYKKIFRQELKGGCLNTKSGLTNPQLKEVMHENFYVFSDSFVLLNKKGEPSTDRMFEILSGVSDVDLVVVDTARRSHDLNENDSAEMSMYVRLLEEIAKELDCACLLLHHSSKQGVLSKAQGVDTGATAARGSGALVDNGRGTWVMCKLPKNEAKEFGITEEDRGKYVLLEHEKCNSDQAHPRTILERIEGGLLQIADLKKLTDDESSTSKGTSSQSKFAKKGLLS